MIFRQNLFRVSEPFIHQQACQLQRYQPIYVGRRRYGPTPEGAQSHTLQAPNEWQALPKIGWQMLTRNPRPYRALLHGANPALVHAHFGIDGVYALPLARQLGVPLITTFHGYDATLSTPALLSNPAWANYPLFRRSLARHGALFLCVSSFIRDCVLAAGFPADRTHVHYTGIDSEAVVPRTAAEERPVILHVARLVEMKGTEYLIRAFASLAPRHLDTRLVIIGDGPLRQKLRALVEQLGLGQRVQFLGALPQAQVMVWMRSAAMLVLPSVRTRTGRVEGLGMVLLEAAATGVPVIGSKVGGLPEGLVDGQTGFLVPERDHAALARRIEDLLDAPALRVEMGIAARTFVARRFDGRRQGERLEAFYDSVLPRGRVAADSMGGGRG